MAFLKDLSDRVWNFVSPRKTIQRRDKPFKVPAVPLKTKPAKDVAMTPQTKIGKWQVVTPRSASSLDDTLLPPSPSSMAQPRDDELEGDTLIHESVETPPKESSEIDWDANEDTMVVDDGRYMEQQKTIDREKERARQEVQARELRQAGWPEDAVFLFQKLGLRGFEPLLPDDWVNDFPTLPVDLFTHSEDKAFVKTESGQDFRGELASVHAWLNRSDNQQPNAPLSICSTWVRTLVTPSLPMRPSARPSIIFASPSRGTTSGLQRTVVLPTSGTGSLSSRPSSATSIRRLTSPSSA